MAGGPILPSSIYVGGAGGLLSPTFFVSGAGTTPSQSYIEGIAAVSSLGSNASAILQFNLPEVLPTGVCKLRVLGWSNASTGNAILTISDGQTAPGNNIANTTLTTESGMPATVSFVSAANNIVENKYATATTPTVNNILTVNAQFTASSWTLAQISVWQFSLVWE